MRWSWQSPRRWEWPACSARFPGQGSLSAYFREVIAKLVRKGCSIAGFLGSDLGSQSLSLIYSGTAFPFLARAANVWGLLRADRELARERRHGCRRRTGQAVQFRRE